MVMAGSLLCRYRALQPRHDRRLVPLHRAEMPTDLAALAVDEQARRQAGRIDRECRLRRRIDVERQRLDPNLGIELLRNAQALLIDRKRDDLKALAAEFGLQAV